MTIHGGPETLDVVVRMLAGFWGEGSAPLPLGAHSLDGGAGWRRQGIRDQLFPVRHRDTDSFGFTLEIPARRHLEPDRPVALGGPDGPLRNCAAPLEQSEASAIVPARGRREEIRYSQNRGPSQLGRSLR